METLWRGRGGGCEREGEEGVEVVKEKEKKKTKTKINKVSDLDTGLETTLPMNNYNTAKTIFSSLTF